MIQRMMFKFVVTKVIYLLILTECLRYNNLAHDTVKKTVELHRGT